MTYSLLESFFYGALGFMVLLWVASAVLELFAQVVSWLSGGDDSWI